jgi:hypothetical protein
MPGDQCLTHAGSREEEKKERRGGGRRRKMKSNKIFKKYF